MSFYKITFVFLFLSTIHLSVYAQVGINTTTPDPSAVLDIVSTTQGMLTPRMTSLQRNAIAAPATGLIVFDTNENTFYFYSGTVWLKIDERNNYKLVSNVSDLADELAAGGGTSYLLTPTTYYEINGTITLAAPINLNDAYVSGLDANEDRLVRVGGTVFSGTKGGGVRNVTIVAPGGSVFSLTGSGIETLILQNCIIANSASVGTITNFWLVFMNIIQFVSNTTGITYTNITNLLLSNVAWFESNAGTYETYVGTFSLIQKISGFCKVPTGATGINVSSNPTVAAGNMLSTIFSGAGTYVNGYGSGSYPTYKFTNKWNVDCPGLKLEKDNNASANFYYNGALTSGFSQNITSGIAVEIQGTGTFTATNLFRFTNLGGNRLIYDGIADRSFQVNASLSVRVTGATGDFYAILIAKNGVLITESNAIVYIVSDAQIQNVSINSNVTMSNGNYIEIYAQRLTGSGTDSLQIFSENLSVK